MITMFDAKAEADWLHKVCSSQDEEEYDEYDEEEGDIWDEGN